MAAYQLMGVMTMARVVRPLAWNTAQDVGYVINQVWKERPGVEAVQNEFEAAVGGIFDMFMGRGGDGIPHSSAEQAWQKDAPDIHVQVNTDNLTVRQTQTWDERKDVVLKQGDYEELKEQAARYQDIVSAQERQKEQDWEYEQGQEW